MSYYMGGILSKGRAKIDPTLQTEKSWYLAIFAIYHPMKPDKIRMIFDSSAVYDGISLNPELLFGPIIYLVCFLDFARKELQS